MKRVAHLLLFAGWLAPAASAQDHVQVGAYGDRFRLDHVMMEGEMNYDVDRALTQTSTSSTSAPTVVQHKSAASESASGLTVTLNANIGPGHLLVVGASTNDGETIDPPTDADGDAFVLAVRSDNTGGRVVNAIYYVPSTKGGHNSVTCHIYRRRYRLQRGRNRRIGHSENCDGDQQHAPRLGRFDSHAQGRCCCRYCPPSQAYCLRKRSLR